MRGNLEMHKKILSGMKKTLLVVSPFLLAVCLVSTAAAFSFNAASLNALSHVRNGGAVNNANTNTNNSSGTNLPNGRPFQILQNEITALQNQVNTMQSQIGTMHYEVLTVQTNGGAVTLPLDFNDVSIVEGGKDVRFEITFVPSPTSTIPVPTLAAGDTYIMSAMTASMPTSPNGELSYIGTNSNGTLNAGNTATFSSADIATITNIGSLVATSDVGYEIDQLSTAPAGTYYVKVIY